MEVINKVTDETMPFSEVNKGELFRTREGFFLKSETAKDCNAVNVSTGNLCFFGKDSKVIPLIAEIVVRNTKYCNGELKF